MSDKVCIFAGQGAQVPGMGKDFAADGEIAALFARANDILGFDLRKICFEGPAEELTKSNICQPAIFVVSVAAYMAYMKKFPGTKFMMAGGLIGVPAAWRGAWWLELGAAGAVMSGFIFLAALDLAAHPDILPGYSELRTALIALFFLSRALRIAPDMYAPGKGPNTPTREAQVRAETMVALADEAAREARERRAD